MSKKKTAPKKEKAEHNTDFDQACAYLMHLGKIHMILWLLGLKLGDMKFESWLRTKNIPWPGQENRTCDTVAHLTDERTHGIPWMIVIEFQIEADELMFGRLLGYIGSCWIVHKPSKHSGDRFQVGAVVVNLTGRGNCSRQMQLEGSQVVTHMQVVEWNFQDQSAETLLEKIVAGEAPRLALVWLPLFQGGGDDKVIERAVQLADEETDPNVRRAFELILLFAEKAGCLDPWRKALEGFNLTRSEIADQWR